MKLTVLTENNTYIDKYYIGEPGLCFYIEDAGEKILFDTGYSDVFIRNAEAMHIDLGGVTTIVFSHGHDDHTRGLKFFCDDFVSEKVKMIVHPDAMTPKFIRGLAVGMPFSEKELSLKFKLQPSKEPAAITEHLTFLGEIPVSHDFEVRKPMGVTRDDTGDRGDLLFDDTALVHKNEKGLFIITGCSHSGICNIIEYAKKVCGDERIRGVIGGFHLFDVTPRLTETIRYFKENRIGELYPCHCVNFRAKAEIDKTIPIREVGVGMTLTF
jgi:7,8-dihydropterin-6-yl-methyl-4-(beta-D-ribofuranosyl)aminobenzene 5'-phosphate synthase